jgi:polyphosphate kinase
MPANVITRVDIPGERLLNRELSLLDFQSRVLELAADFAIPLLERVFCAIFPTSTTRSSATDLDEVVRVR